jgi:hypothetical protein
VTDDPLHRCHHRPHIDTPALHAAASAADREPANTATASAIAEIAFFIRASSTVMIAGRLSNLRFVE